MRMQCCRAGGRWAAANCCGYAVEATGRMRGVRGSLECVHWCASPPSMCKGEGIAHKTQQSVVLSGELPHWHAHGCCGCWAALQMVERDSCIHLGLSTRNGERRRGPHTRIAASQCLVAGSALAYPSCWHGPR